MANIEDGASMPQIGVTRRSTIGALSALAAMPVTASTARGDPSPGDAPTGPAVTPEQFGAKGDGVTDDTAALQAAFDQRRSVRLSDGRRYLLRAPVTLPGNGVTVTGGGTLCVAPDFRLASAPGGNWMMAIRVTGTDVVLDGIGFDAVGAPMGSAVENGFLWITAPYATIRNCRFVNLIKGSAIWGLGEAAFLSVLGCRFRRCSGAVVAKGRSSVISDNIIVDATDAAIAINGRACIGAVVANNAIGNETGAIIPAMIAVEEAASDWSITGNTLIGVNGGGIACINVLDTAIARGGVIAGNVLDGRLADGRIPRTRNPGAMLGISSRYRDWIVRGNTIANPPIGNPNTRAVSIAATGGLFEGNIIDAAEGEELSALVEIVAETRGLAIRNNVTRGFPGTRHYLFAPGDYGNAPCRFTGGTLIAGEVGIDAQFHTARITRLQLHIEDIEQASPRTLVDAAAAIGDRAAFLNAGAWRLPHRIGFATSMSCTAPPSDSGALAFASGDRFYPLVPRPGDPVAFVRAGAGWARMG